MLPERLTGSLRGLAFALVVALTAATALSDVGDRLAGLLREYNSTSSGDAPLLRLAELRPKGDREALGAGWAKGFCEGRIAGIAAVEGAAKDSALAEAWRAANESGRPTVFVSFGRDDAALAERVRKFFDRKGWLAFTYIRTPGEKPRFSEKMVGGLFQTADHHVVLNTEVSLKSLGVVLEYWRLVDPPEWRPPIGLSEPVADIAQLATRTGPHSTVARILREISAAGSTAGDRRSLIATLPGALRELDTNPDPRTRFDRGFGPSVVDSLRQEAIGLLKSYVTRWDEVGERPVAEAALLALVKIDPPEALLYFEERAGVVSRHDVLLALARSGRVSEASIRTIGKCAAVASVTQDDAAGLLYLIDRAGAEASDDRVRKLAHRTAEEVRDTLARSADSDIRGLAMEWRHAKKEKPGLRFHTWFLEEPKLAEPGAVERIRRLIRRSMPRFK